MFKKISKKLKPKELERPRHSVDGAAVPYFDDDDRKSPTSPTKAPLSPRGLAAATVEGGASYLLSETAARGDVSGVRELLKAGADINGYDDDGNTALHRAAARGQSRVITYLLLKGADIEAKDKRKQTALAVAVEQGQTGTVGVLLDYMHSVDSRPRHPFVFINAQKASKKQQQSAFIRDSNCSRIKSFKKQGFTMLKVLICLGQAAEDIAIFLYSILDIPVQHAFFLNTMGDMNMKNFQRFETKTQSQSLTVLNTMCKSVEAVGYERMRCLILVSCDLLKLTLGGLNNIELLDVRYNRLDHLPENINHCVNLKTLKCAHNNLRRLPRELGDLLKLVYLDCSYNHMKRLTSHIVKCSALKTLECNHNGLIELPMDIALLSKVEELVVNNNKLAQLPISVSTLSQLQKIKFHNNPLLNIPTDFPERASEVRAYLKCLLDDPIPNHTVKLVLVGQEGVGKSTLLKALKRTFWAIPRTPTTPKTDGIDVKDIQLDDFTLRCFDCGGDVDFNETHNFFITQGALYVACFNLAEYTGSMIERSSFLLGRLQLWLQYIFSKVPNAQVLIVGTHADHESLTRPIFEEIWEQLRTLLVSAREHHRSYFRRQDRLADCLLCQSDSKCLRKNPATGPGPGFVNLGYDDAASSEDETSFVDGPESVVAFPHIVGYYEVSSIKSVGNSSILQMNTNQSIEYLKDAIKELSKRLIETNPTIPRRWANVQQSLGNQIELNPENCISSIQEVSTIAKAQGVQERSELLSMLHFFKAQGSILYFPQIVSMEDIVILDAQWLAQVFSAVVSYRETGISAEGFIDRDELKAAWESSVAVPDVRNNILMLLRHFGLCLPVSDTNMELFPCKLPLGEPDEKSWPVSPSSGERQLTYNVIFPSMIPPPLFSELIVLVYRNRVEHVAKDYSRYFANQILDILMVDRIGCRSCGIKSESPREKDDPNLYHKVHIELVPHRRSICISVRGVLPCCMMKKVGKLLNKVVSKYEGLGTIELNTLICPGCHLQKHPQPHRFNINRIFEEVKKGEKLICSNAHVLPEPSKLLVGVILDSCIPNPTIRPKHSRDLYDFSGCPKLPLMLPVNKGGLSFDNDLRLFVSSLLFDGYAIHLLCEFPDGYHLTSAPGYRLKKPKEFMEAFGPLVYSVLHLIRHTSESTVSAKFSKHTKAVASMITDLISDLNGKFPSVKDTSSELSREQLIEKTRQQGNKLDREHLRRFLNVADKPASFGALRRLKYGDQLLWLCNEHYRQLRMLTIGTRRMVQGLQAYIESSA